MAVPAGNMFVTLIAMPDVSGFATQATVNTKADSSTVTNLTNIVNGKAALNHTHDDRYYTESEMNTALNGKADSSTVTNLTNTVNTKASATDLNAVKATADKNKTDIAAINSSFGTISYNGLDGTDTSVFPTSYRKGGTPALPTPEKSGSEFLGWTWSRGGASGDSSNLADAFAEAGTVTLSANWGAPKTSCFFSGTPLDATSGGTHVIRVAIPDAGRAISGAKLKKIDGSGLVIGGRESQVSFALGATSAAAAGSPMTSWDGGDGTWGVNLGGGLTLTEAADSGSHWLYVGINIPASAIDKNSVVKSYAPGDYVASLVTLEYELA